MRSQVSRSAVLLTALLFAAPAAHAGEPIVRHAPASGGDPAAGSVGGPGLALSARKILTAAATGEQVVNNGVLLVRDGRIEAVGPARDIEVPADYTRVDLGDQWLMPGLIDLHCHIAGVFDINDTVYLTNPGVRAYTDVVPDNSMLRRGLAGGVTTVLYIPGSGSNVGGWGTLLKTGFTQYEEMEVRRAGSLKLAQAGNPERWTTRPARTFMNYNTRSTFRRGVAYGKRWQAFENGEGPEPERDIQFDIFRHLVKKEAQVSTHTQMAQVVQMTILMIRKEMGLDVYIDHGTFDGFKMAGLAQELGVPAILGPRSIEPPNNGWIRAIGVNEDGRVTGVAAAYQERGHKAIGLNTDAPVIPQEELTVQASMAVHYGFDDSTLDVVRAMTIVPAQTAGIAHDVGSLEVGKQADILVVTGHPADQRTSIERIWIEGREVYDAEVERRW